MDCCNSKGRNFTRLTGRFNPVWVAETIKALGLDGKEYKDQHGTTIRLLNRAGKEPALALIGDHDLVLAGFNSGGNDQEVLDQALALRDKKQDAAPSAALKTRLAKTPAQALGYLAGEVPDEVRRGFSQGFGACPKKILAYVDRAGGGIDFILQGGMDDEAQAKTFVQAVSKMRMDAINALDKAPAFPVPGVNIDDLKSMVNSMQFEGTGKDIHVRMLLSEGGMKILPMFFILRSAGAPAPPAAKQGN